MTTWPAKVHIGWRHARHDPTVHGRFVEAKGLTRQPRVFSKEMVQWLRRHRGAQNIKTVAACTRPAAGAAPACAVSVFAPQYAGRRAASASTSNMVLRAPPSSAARAFGYKKDISRASLGSRHYKLSDVKGNRMRVTTPKREQLIARRWLPARFSTDHPEIIEGLVRGIFPTPMEEMKLEANRPKMSRR